jgi:hypothetical protein
MKTNRLTLVEITLMLAIVVSLILTLIPLFEPAYLKGTVNDEGTRLAAFIRRVQEKAARTGMEYRIHFNTDAGAAEIVYVGSNGEEKKSGYIALDSNISIAQSNLPDNTLSFNSNGMPSQEGRIELHNSKNKKTIIVIDSVSGKVTIEKYP